MEINDLKKGDKFYKVYGFSPFNVDVDEMSVNECECTEIKTWVEHYDFPSYLGGSEDTTEFDLYYTEKYPDGKIRLNRALSTKSGSYVLTSIFKTRDEALAYVNERVGTIVKMYEEKILKLKDKVGSIVKNC